MSARALALRCVGAVPAIMCAALLSIACGGGSDEIEIEPPPRDEPLTGKAPSAQRITIGVTESGDRFRYTAPAIVPAGLVEIRLRNDGAVAHKAQLWRIAGNHGVAQARSAGRPRPSWLRAAGGVALTEPGATGTTIQNLAPGRYYVAGTGGEQGTVAQLRVTGRAARGALPSAAARVDTVEFGFRQTRLQAGRRPVTFRNTGREPHHVYFAPLRPGATLDEVRRFFTTDNYSGRPPVADKAVRETVVLEGGQRQVTELDLRSGRYALLCFVRNRRGGPPHTELGMIDELRVR